ncbi:response regulator [Fundidesulfovibrio butyratiphilus]
MNENIYDKDVREFVGEYRGVFLVYSQDAIFIKNLRATLVRHLQLKEDCASVVNTQEQLLKQITVFQTQHHKVLIFIEYEINGKSCHDLVRFLKSQLQDVMVVVLTGEVAREALIYLHEIGANNIITRPISPNLLIEKIAFTVKPRGQIGELIDAGKKCVNEGKFVEAANLATKILELKPGSPAGLILLGDSFKGMNKNNEALSAYTKAMKNAQLYLEPIKKIAQLHRDTGNVAEETKMLERLDRLSPLNVERKIDLGGNYVALGDADRAKTIFDDAVKLANKEASSQLARVSRAIAERCASHAPALSEQFLRQALEAKKGQLDKSDIDTFNRLGITLRKQGRWAEAIQEYEKAVKVSPEDGALYYNMAMAFSEGRRFSDACYKLDKALELTPDLWEGNETVCVNIAMVYYLGVNKKLAVKYARLALEINPQSPRATEILNKV